MLVALLIGLVGVWLLLGLICTMRITNRMCSGENGRVVLVILLVTHGAGFGFLMAGGLIWAVWLMISFPFKLMAKAWPLDPTTPVTPALTPVDPRVESEWETEHQARGAGLYFPADWHVQAVGYDKRDL
jgi:hypothetical protein